MTTSGQHYSDTGRDFLARARTYLAEDDLSQASEKGWGAAAPMVKVAAESRAWRHRGHRDLYTAINRLADETGDPNLRRLFHTASSLHANFYEGWQPREMVEQGLSDVAEPVETLDALEA